MAWMLPRNALPRPRTAVVFIRRLFIGVVFIYALVSLTLGGTPTARWALYAGAALWCGVSLAFMLLSSDGRTTKKSRWSGLFRGLELVCVNIALTLVLGEGGLRLVGFCSGNSLILSDALDNYRLVPGRDYGHGLRGDSLGFPGEDFVREKRPGIFRIAALGDSFAVG